MTHEMTKCNLDTTIKMCNIFGYSKEYIEEVCRHFPFTGWAVRLDTWYDAAAERDIVRITSDAGETLMIRARGCAYQGAHWSVEYRSVNVRVPAGWQQKAARQVEYMLNLNTVH